MARDQEPVRDEEFAAATHRLDELREQVREVLAVDLGGDPEDYNADIYHIDEPIADGTGESEIGCFRTGSRQTLDRSSP